MINAIVLAGGLGTRLAQAVPHLPKVLAPIRGVPFLKLLLQQLKETGLVSKAVLALGHRAEIVREWTRDSFVEYSVEETPLGTGGAILRALSNVESKELLILNGDSFFDLDFQAFCAFHRKQRGDLTLACRHVEDVGRYGVVLFNEDRRVISFAEKSMGGPGWISAGIYLVRKEMLEKNNSLGACSFEQDLMPKFLQGMVFAYPHSGTFIDIGTPSSYALAQDLLQPWVKT